MTPAQALTNLLGSTPAGLPEFGHEGRWGLTGLPLRRSRSLARWFFVFFPLTSFLRDLPPSSPSRALPHSVCDQMFDESCCRRASSPLNVMRPSTDWFSYARSLSPFLGLLRKESTLWLMIISFSPRKSRLPASLRSCNRNVRMPGVGEDNLSLPSLSHPVEASLATWFEIRQVPELPFLSRDPCSLAVPESRTRRGQTTSHSIPRKTDRGLVESFSFAVAISDAAFDLFACSANPRPGRRGRSPAPRRAGS